MIKQKNIQIIYHILECKSSGFTISHKSIRCYTQTVFESNNITAEIRQLLKTILLGTARILQKVLEISDDQLQLDFLNIFQQFSSVVVRSIKTIILILVITIMVIVISVKKVTRVTTEVKKMWKTKTKSILQNTLIKYLEKIFFKKCRTLHLKALQIFFEKHSQCKTYNYLQNQIHL